MHESSGDHGKGSGPLTVPCPPRHYPDPHQIDEETRALLEEHAFRYGRGYDSYLAVEPDREYFFCSDRRGLVAFVRRGRHVSVIGGLLAPPDAWDLLLAEFMEFATGRGNTLAFFNLDRAQLPVFRERGFEITRIGHDAIVDLRRLTWEGGEYAWVRRQSNFCQRRGLVCSEYRPDLVPADQRSRVAAELAEVSEEHLRTTLHGNGLRYFVGRVDARRLGRRRVFLARAGHGCGRIEGFILCNPCRGGERWAVETLRRRSAATRGVIPFIVHHALQTLKDEGVAQVSLSMVPALLCDEPQPGDSTLVRGFMRVSVTRLGAFLDLQGIYHFKSRFRPQLEGCYLAAYPRMTVWSLRACLKTWGIHRIHPLRLVRRLVSRISKRDSRRTLIPFATDGRPADSARRSHRGNCVMSPSTTRWPVAERFNRYPFWTPRFWSGMKLSTWLRLLRRNGFRFTARRLPRVGYTTALSALSSLIDPWQRLLYDRRIREVQLPESPIIIIGHWRSGTTFLHELLSQDDRFAAPTTFQVSNPHHWLLTEAVLTRSFGFLLPAVRPMDNVTIGMNHPQEDEWALCNMGVPTPFLRIVFPSEPPPFLEYFDFEGVPERDRQRWKDAFLYVLKMLTLRHGKPLLLKSPYHTGRIKLLLEIFPAARFVHTVRNPYELFPSTIRMWRSFDRTQGLQPTNLEMLEEFVFQALERMYRSFDEQRRLLGDGQLCEVRYEDLVRDPVAQVQRIYTTLRLDDFDRVRPKVEGYVESKRGYQPNMHELLPETRARIAQRWAGYFERCGYSRGAA